MDHWANHRDRLPLALAGEKPVRFGWIALIATTSLVIVMVPGVYLATPGQQLRWTTVIVGSIAYTAVIWTCLTLFLLFLRSLMAPVGAVLLIAMALTGSLFRSSLPVQAQWMMATTVGTWAIMALLICRRRSPPLPPSDVPLPPRPPPALSPAGIPRPRPRPSPLVAHAERPGK